MKIATLLAQYLYTHKRLELAGIGVFTLDANAVQAAEASKSRTNILDGISFESMPSTKESPELIAFVSERSGKMKALAAADIDSHLLLVQQFLNIGKPFTFEGIGTIIKLKSGAYEFIPGTVAAEKTRETTSTDTVPVTAERDDLSKPKKPYESFLTAPPRSNSTWLKPVVGFLAICGLALAVWGGYAISKKKSPPPVASVNEELPLPVKDTFTTLMATDSADLSINTHVVPDTLSQPVTVAEPITSDTYKYVLEVAQSDRAFKRYNQLRTNQWAVQLETRDSLQYKLYLLLPRLNADTTKVLDSLTVMTGRRVYIDHAN